MATRVAPELETTPCAVCGGSATNVVLTGRDNRRHVPGEFQVVRCCGCDLVYINPRPTTQSIGQYYPPDYSYHEAGPSGRIRQLYYRMFRRLSLAPGARVLDVGCGGGGYLLYLRDRGYAVAGVEPNRELAARLGREYGLDIRPGELLEARWPDASFDAVMFWWVLEHSHDPMANLREAYRILKPGGVIIVALQNFASLSRLLFGADWHHIDIPTHLYQFEPHTLRKALETAGFDAVRIRHDLIAKDAAPSVGYRLALKSSLDWWLPNLLALPVDLLAWSIRRSGLMTAYARRPK